MDPGAQATLGGGLEPDVAPMAARDVAGDRQTETDPSGGRVARSIEAHEGPEHTAPVSGRNSWTVVIDDDVDPVGDCDTGQPDMGAVAARIGDQITETTP
jgi:hypothetical protein